eukprot:3126055-Amphidinium_carterae.3
MLPSRSMVSSSSIRSTSSELEDLPPKRCRASSIASCTAVFASCLPFPQLLAGLHLFVGLAHVVLAPRQRVVMWPSALQVIPTKATICWA